MTAKGVLQFLEGRCYPVELEEQLATGDVRLFNRITARELLGKIEEKVRTAERRKHDLGEDIRKLLEKGGGDAERLPSGLRERIEEKHANRVTLKKNIHKWTRLGNWVAHAAQKRAELSEQMRRMMGAAERCDTQTTGLDDTELLDPEAEAEEESVQGTITVKKGSLWYW